MKYKSFDDCDIPAIYYEPNNWHGKKSINAIVFVHGDPGWHQNDCFDPLIQFLLSLGYAVIAPNYRGSSGNGKSFSDANKMKCGEIDLLDCIYAKKYLKKKEYIYKDNICIIGTSYGGFLALCAMTFYPNDFSKCIDMYGFSDFICQFEFMKKRTLNIPSKMEYEKWGDPDKNQELLYNRSPINYVENITKPIMIVHGKNDPRVSFEESERFVEKMKEHNKYTLYEKIKMYLD